jgi:hypothetical protein
MLDEFKKLARRGNALDLAVGITWEPDSGEWSTRWWTTF